MTVGYKNVETPPSSNVVYKVGSKVGQQCSDGSSPRPACCTTALSNNHQTDSVAACNIIALLMYIRSHSPDSSLSLSPPSNSSFTTTPTTPNTPTTPATATTTTTTTPTSSRTSSDGREERLSFPHASTFPSNCYSSLHQSSFIGRSEQTLSRGGSSLLSGEGKVGCELLKRGDNYTHLPNGERNKEKSSLVSDFGDQQFGGLTHGSMSSRMLVGWGHHQKEATHLEGPELSSSSSSIGACDDSSCSSGEGSNEASSVGDMEVESAPRGGPLLHMGTLEEALPIKRRLSRFFNGKAKSFTSLAEVTSIEDLAKPNNPYSKRRRIPFGERHKSFPPLSCSSATSISKRPISTSGSRSGLAVAVAMSSKLEEAPEHQHSQTHPVSVARFASRSLSLTDLMQASSKGV